MWQVSLQEEQVIVGRLFSHEMQTAEDNCVLSLDLKRQQFQLGGGGARL